MHRSRRIYIYMRCLYITMPLWGESMSWTIRIWTFVDCTEFKWLVSYIQHILNRNMSKTYGWVRLNWEYLVLNAVHLEVSRNTGNNKLSTWLNARCYYAFVSVFHGSSWIYAANAIRLGGGMGLCVATIRSLIVHMCTSRHSPNMRDVFIYVIAHNN